MNKRRDFCACALSICACATIFAGNNNSLDAALIQYQHAAASLNSNTYIAACKNLLAAVQNSSYGNAQIAYKTVRSTPVLLDPFPYAMTAALGLASALGKGNPFLLLHTGIHFFHPRTVKTHNY